MIKIKSYSLTNMPLINEVLISYINNFWNEVFSPIVNNSTSDKHLMLMCKVEFTDAEMGYRTLGHLRRVTINDKELFVGYLIERLASLNDSYFTHPISKITFSYIEREGLATDRKLLQDLSDKTITNHTFNNMNLPITMVPSEYGIIVTKPALYDTFTRYIASTNKRMYQIDVSLDNLINNVTVLGLSDLKWIDTRLSGGGFKREIGKSTIYFMDGEIVLRKAILSAKPFRKPAVDKKLNTNFVTMDIETINVDNKLTPYLISGYNGSSYITSYANSSMHQKDLFVSFINQLLSFFGSTKSLTVYAHNLSGFDGIFLMKHLIALGKVEPLIFNGKLMSIKIRLNNKFANGDYLGKTIVFKDSYLLLPLSLRKLCEAFGITMGKGHFPFKLNDIFYVGVLPKLALWTGISLNEYDSLISRFIGKAWSFKDEAIKYCHLDCKTLHEVLTQFNELIFKEFQINIHGSLTLPALAIRIFKTHYMVKDTIYQILGKVEAAIRQSYTGGAVDVYVPHNRIGSFLLPVKAMFKKLFSYDVNALYPTVMAKHPMPIGKPVFFEGDILRIYPDAYGFFYCKITSPEYLEHPILQRRIKTSGGMRTVAGLGTWTGWIASGEMSNAMKYGYTFIVLKGYQFEKGEIFSGYVSKLFELRQQYVIGHPLNLIAKLLMNSLYGKFGMKTETTKVEMFDISTKEGKAGFDKALDTYGDIINSFVRVDDTLIIVRDSLIDMNLNNDEEVYHGIDVNIAIASTITSAARVFMSIFKNNPNFTLYYSDTDNVVTDQPLPDSIVGKELGQFKLEYTIKKAVFLAPKVYGLVTEGGQEIIKVKGLTPEVASNIHINDLEYLLIKDSSKEFNQEKWNKKVMEGEISISDVAYNLKVTSNKRAPIYVDGVYQDTKPYNYEDIINNK